MQKKWKNKDVDVQGKPIQAKVIANCMLKAPVNKRLLTDIPSK
jgi:hypothetical protein